MRDSESHPVQASQPEEETCAPKEPALAKVEQTAPPVYPESPTIPLEDASPCTEPISPVGKPAVDSRTGAPVVAAEPPRRILEQEARYDLCILATSRLVRLPQEGRIILGRVEYGVKYPPDVDLAYDDSKTQSVAQHHACITGKGGRHWIEDLGSANGTYLNDRQLTAGEKAELSEGDQIMLGACKLLYEPYPSWAAKLDPNIPRVSLLVVTHTGQPLELPAKRIITIGRPDPVVGYMPDIDLGVAGKIASHVSRHHARIILRDGWHYLEDAGSSTGTRVNGISIYRNDPLVRLHTGDQLWLGGCVLAYEWKLR